MYSFMSGVWKDKVTEFDIFGIGVLRAYHRKTTSCINNFWGKIPTVLGWSWEILQQHIMWIVLFDVDATKHAHKSMTILKINDYLACKIEYNVCYIVGDARPGIDLHMYSNSTTTLSYLAFILVIMTVNNNQKKKSETC